MNELDILMRRIIRASLFFMSACLFAWALVPALKPYAAGLVLGVCTSLINGRILQSRIYAITRIALANTGKRASLGFLSRASTIFIALAICLRVPAFHLGSTISGFFFVQTLAFLFGLGSAIQHKLHSEKR
ncbi:ATP synthase subunit I [Paenibacillus sp. YN15]|uniref:ATP synthase subunit I n=1 Tax=Paenibacillus sp. YN15 TaxID=1742774 RepID=UPI000DCBD303|nr:ATP synthase subunit I [Paenibacillus sp. YN15]RAV03155.1 ATP synthase subunit I [Paenibacillus sp. YN15]